LYLLDEDWEDACKDTSLKFKGVVGSGNTDVNYLEIGLTKGKHDSTSIFRKQNKFVG
jgi:hypothetical protein